MKRPLLNTFSAITIAMSLASCGTDPNSPGVEYMPDMYRSPALEAYVDYGSNKHMDWTQSQKDEAGVKPVLSRKPAPGSIAYAKGDDALFAMPYSLPNDMPGYERSATEIHSPLLSNKVNIEEGKRLFLIFCKHCHGEEGHGDGAISKNGLIKVPDYSTQLKNLEEGKMYHTLQYGKNAMGSHASQLNQKERWQILEWVKCLQKGNSAPSYDEAGMLVVVAEAAPEVVPEAAPEAAPAAPIKK